jgi:hypothetical protein
MRNISRGLGVLVVVMAIASIGFAQATPPPPAAPPGERPAPAPGAQAAEKAFTGTLVKVDTTAKTLTAKGADNKDVVFAYTDKTEVVGSEKTVQGLAAKSGSKLRIMYKAEGANNAASRIEVMPD